MTNDAVRLEITDAGVAVVSLARGDRLNIFDLEMRDGFIDAVAAVRDIPGIGAMVLRADGKHFSAGADIREFGSADHMMEARRIRWDRDPWGPLWDLPVPTIVAFHGYAVGAGLEMAMLCDIRFASAETKLALPETTLGMLPSAGGTQSLTRAIGTSAAFPVVATSRTFTAHEALDRGFVHRVVDDPEAVEKLAIDTATMLAGQDPSALRAARRALHVAGDVPLDQGLAIERDLARVVSDTAGR